MQRLMQLVADASKKASVTEKDLINLIREYLQILILKAIYQSKYGEGVSFMGGTCLRICHRLKRYSEDLDFTLDKKIPGYSFSEWNELVARFLMNEGFDVNVTSSEDKVVQKSFIRVAKILHATGLSPLLSQKVHIKLEIDTRPVPIAENEKESFFVSEFDEYFPILKHTDPTLFAGKICAVLNRAYTKGRDFYDLIWYLNKGVPINFKYLNAAFRQAGLQQSFSDTQDVFNELQKKMATIDIDSIMKDLEPFLEDDSETTWLLRYPEAFEKAAERYLNSF